MLPYDPTLVPLAKKLRSSMTPWEIRLWTGFLCAEQPRWQRQKPVLDYIVDFYCAKARLALELDGGWHYEPLKKLDDDRRTARIEAVGVKVMRIANHEIDRNFEGVCWAIRREVERRLGELGRG